MPTLYEILKIDKNATLGEIKDAYKRLSLQWHPDSFNRGNSPAKTKEEADEMFKKIKEAYEILSDPQKRNEYDNSIGNAQQWLINYLKQRFSNQESSPYTISVGGRRTYNPSRVATNPRFKVDSLDAIKNKNLEGSLSLVDFTGLKELDLSGNRITKLEVNNCPNLQVIRCDNNPITNLKLIDKNIEIHFSQEELLRNKKELEYLNEDLLKQVDDLKGKKLSLEEEIVKLKDLSRKDKEKLEWERDSRPNITLDEWNNKQTIIQRLQEESQEMSTELVTERKELQRLGQDLSISRRRVYDLEVILNNKQNELTNASRDHQFEVGQIGEYASSLENANLSQQREINWLNKQLTDLKIQKLEKQKVELDRLVANVKDKLDIRRQEKIDDLLGAQEELNKNSGNLFVQKQFEKVKEELARKLDEKEITNILAKQEEVWKSQLEFIDESSRITMIENLEKDIDKQQKYFEKLLDSVKEKVKKSKINLLTDDYQPYLEEFLKLQALIVHSGNKLEIHDYLFER